ncbi:alpha/beta fold hydrolase [Cohnella faecalis]|uniref:Alpha/beta hydrolase n=1 Tax=Cohnella faecalis TaxID=2315694 RepID=A0A398CT85_9BACL|nr:alpha/beta hydrolase [Cohnella faecalis]RIE04469.1 alpha/beta hydrolase [Cohnella faecalis]
MADEKIDELPLLEWDVEGPDGSLHLIGCGDPKGRPVLFLHGITENARAFEPAMRKLPDGIFAAAMDLRGRGLSAKPMSGYRLANYTEDLLAVCNGWSGKAPVIVGHSMGARVAAAFAALYPGLVGGVLLIDPPLSGPGQTPFPVPLSRFVEPKRALERGDMATFRSYYTSPDFDYERKARELGGCSLEAIEQSHAAMNTDPFHAYYRMLSVPALLVAAGGAPFISMEAEMQLREINPRVRTARLEGIGHEIHKLAPALFLQTVRDFLTSMDNEGARA